MCFNENWRYQFTPANNFYLLELISVALDELQRPEKYPIRWVSLYQYVFVFYIIFHQADVAGCCDPPLKKTKDIFINVNITVADDMATPEAQLRKTPKRDDMCHFIAYMYRDDCWNDWTWLQHPVQ